ncbi:hypothetical protein LZ575_00950 [Antarcticibacterium sp. 1MA-6-2]|uniref:hypothetical protein n=1 Tax=Antarcticibacterium sp. 1MA-6-2 TaxID=2908210 RepID=UPI001F166738|nr:hypothetical protein [Antarcticibacterium sp. 1MA-6-2]UJH91389.1 hypothetical protein LZ575_00950 [Antarcticibacterium sp. 1MA-6-2]
MKNFYYILLFIGIALLIFNAARLSFDDLSWEENSNAYLGIIGPLLIILAMILAIRSTKKKKAPEEDSKGNLYGNE